MEPNGAERSRNGPEIKPSRVGRPGGLSGWGRGGGCKGKRMSLGYFHFARLLFGDPPKRPFKTSTKLTSLSGYFDLARLIFALPGKRLKITRKDS